MKASEEQINFAEDIAAYVKKITNLEEFDSYDFGIDVAEEVTNLSDKYNLEVYQEESLSDAFIDIYFIIKSLNVKRA